MRDDLTPQERVWVLLSDLFLDTDIAPMIDGHARALAASPYEVSELERMLRDDVYPVCIWNLRSVAGNWTGFDADGLVRSIRERRVSRGLMHRMCKPIRARNLRRMVPEWDRIRRRVMAIRLNEANAGGGIPK